MGTFRGNRLAKKGKVWYFTSTVNQGQKLDPCLSTQAMADYWCCFETRNPVLSCKKALFGPVAKNLVSNSLKLLLLGPQEQRTETERSRSCIIYKERGRLLHIQGCWYGWLLLYSIRQSPCMVYLSNYLQYAYS